MELKRIKFLLFDFHNFNELYTQLSLTDANSPCH